MLRDPLILIFIIKIKRRGAAPLGGGARESIKIQKDLAFFLNKNKKALAFFYSSLFKKGKEHSFRTALDPPLCRLLRRGAKTTNSKN
jgi:hypothetical protein